MSTISSFAVPTVDRVPPPGVEGLLGEAAVVGDVGGHR